MADAGYALGAAAADLAAAGLLDGALLAAAGHWRPRAVAEAAALPGAFAGAALDSRAVRTGELFVALPGERADGRDFIAAACAAGAAGALAAAWAGAGEDPLLAEPARRDGAVVLLARDPRAALALLAARWRSRLPVLVAGVTGTNGKTTTKDLMAAMLAGAGATHATAGNLNNELGLPLTVLGLTAAHRFAVIEMGASAPGEIARLAPLAAPRVGIITNASPAHLAGFGSLAAIVAAKGELLDALPADGTAVLNADSAGFAEWARRARCTVAAHGERAGDHRWRWSAGDDPARGSLELDGQTWEVPLPGRHNGGNLAAALLAARAAGLDEAAIRRGLAAFRPSPHRSRLERVGGVRLLDDCYNANPESVVSAARALVDLDGGGRAIAVLGRMAELGPESAALHRETGRRLAALGLDQVVAVGPEAEALAQGCREAGGAALHLPTQAAAAAWLAAQARAGDRVLVKGSRAAAMEGVVALWRGAAGAGD